MSTKGIKFSKRKIKDWVCCYCDKIFDKRLQLIKHKKEEHPEIKSGGKGIGGNRKGQKHKKEICFFCQKSYF